MPGRADGNPVCGSRQEIAKELSELEKRYDENGTVLITVNDDLPAFRAGVLDDSGICAQRLTEGVNSALQQLEVIDFGRDQQDVDTFVPCVDRLREETDEKMSNATNSIIRHQRLANEMEILNEMTHRVTGLERALLRGVSKRDRLMQELGQYRDEIQSACE